MSNSRYDDTDRTKNVFLIRFLKPHLDRAKSERWAKACRWEGCLYQEGHLHVFVIFIGDIVFTLNHGHYHLSSSWLSMHGINGVH